jgi:hypothetical protein
MAPRYLFQDSPRSLTFVPVQPYGRIETAHRESQPIAVPAVPSAGPQAAQIHHARVEKEFGSWYGRCACGTRSFDCDRQVDADLWVCPYLRAENEAVLAQRVYDRRVAMATLDGYHRD